MVNETGSWFFEKISKMINLQPDSSRKRERDQIKTIRNEKAEVKNNTTDVQRIIRDCY